MVADGSMVKCFYRLSRNLSRVVEETRGRMHRLPLNLCFLKLSFKELWHSPEAAGCSQGTKKR